MSHMTIKRMMIGLLAVLSLLLLMSQGQMLRQAFSTYTTSSQAAVSNVIVSDVLKAASFWALERGVTNAALGGADPASQDVLQKIADSRDAGDKAFDEALAKIGEAALVMPDAYRQNIKNAEESLLALRQAVDKNLALVKTDRDADLSAKWMPGITALIVETQKLRINLSSQSLIKAAALGKDTLIRHSVWLMTEYAGRERGAIAGVIASGDPISPDQLEQLAEFRGKVAEGWSILSSVELSQDEHKQFDSALTAAKEDFFGEYEQVRQKIYAEAKLGVGYGMTAKEWIGRSTQAIDTLNNIQNLSTAWIAVVLDGSQASSKREMLIYGLALLIAVATVIVTIGVIIRRVISPINSLASSMETIAGGALEQRVPYLGRRDEIGNMAKSVEIFRQNGLEKIKLVEKAREAEERSQTERRHAMLSLADKFESNVGGVVNAVTAAAEELHATAKSLMGTAEETSRQSNAVAAASEQMTQNVQTVASATEELTASISEISNQVSESTRIVGGAVTQAEDTNAKVKNLSEAAQKIGAVVTLISEIASQTNLLALNATIEAARAGEAGKGFAVVASEVKNLATQTAKATEEIGGQIKAIQDSTDASAVAIQSITHTIGRVNEISTVIASAVEEQGAATQEISRNVQQAAAGTAEVASNITGVTQASQQTSAGSTQVLSAAGELARNGALLRGQVDEFLREIRAR